jgi:predicted transcriptional regulator
MDQNGTPKEKVSTHVEPDLKEQLERLAKANQRSVAGELRLALISHLEAERLRREVAGEAY